MILSKQKFKFILYTWMVIALVGEAFAFAIGGMQSVYYLIWNGVRGGLTPDLFESIWQAAYPQPYETGAIYPPLVYCVLRFFLLFMVQPFPLLDKWTEMIYLTHSSDGVVIFCIFSLLIFSSLFFLINEFYRGKTYEKVIIFLFLIGSSPFIYMYERGNTVIFSVFFLWIYFSWFNSADPLKREVALVFLSVAICWKIYPVLAGLMLLTVKDQKCIIHAICYTLILFFVPFMFTGGVDSLINMASNITGLSNETVIDTRDFGFGFKVNISNLYLMIQSILGIQNSGKSTLLSLIYFVVLIILFVTLSDSNDRILTIILMMITLPPFSWIYNVTYLFIALVIFLNKKDYSILDILILLLIFLTLIPLPYGYVFSDLPGINQITLSTAICNISLYFIVFVLLGKVVFSKSKGEKFNAG